MRCWYPPPLLLLSPILSPPLTPQTASFHPPTYHGPESASLGETNPHHWITVYRTVYDVIELSVTSR